jgi:hypothetical protein
MKSHSELLGLLLASALVLAPLARAQDEDKETAAALKKANEAAKAMGLPMPDVKKMIDDDAKKEAKQKKKRVDAALAAGPLALPKWTPQIPEFKPDGPISIKKVNDEDRIAQTGTSMLTPAQLADAWAAALSYQKWNLSSGRSNSTGYSSVTLTYRQPKDSQDEVRLIATRDERDKITKVTIASPLPKPADDDDDD